MNKINSVVALPVVLVLGLTGCTDHTKAPLSTKIVASSPSAQQTRDNMRDWNRAGGSAKQVLITGDLISLADNKWRTDPFLTKVVADALTSHVTEAMNFRPVPDQRASNAWASYLADAKILAFTLAGVGGDYQRAGDPHKVQEAAVLLIEVNRDKQQFQARLAQINAVRGTH